MKWPAHLITALIFAAYTVILAGTLALLLDDFTQFSGIGFQQKVLTAIFSTLVMDVIIVIAVVSTTDKSAFSPYLLLFLAALAGVSQGYPHYKVASSLPLTVCLSITAASLMWLVHVFSQADFRRRFRTDYPVWCGYMTGIAAVTAVLVGLLLVLFYFTWEPGVRQPIPSSAPPPVAAFIPFAILGAFFVGNLAGISAIYRRLAAPEDSP